MNDKFPSLKGFDLCLDSSVLLWAVQGAISFHPSKGSTSV